MPIPVGGHRHRAVFDSVYYEVDRVLSALGWFDSGRNHAPIQFLSEALPDKEPIPFNTLVLVAEDVFSPEDLEMGSDLAEHKRRFYIDVYAESDAFGEHISLDLRDAIQGRMPSIGRGQDVIPLYDYSQATPPLIRNMELEFVIVDRSHNFSYPWEKHWRSVGFTVVDCYGNEDDNQ